MSFNSKVCCCCQWEVHQETILYAKGCSCPFQVRELFFTCIFFTTGIALWHRLVEDGGELLPTSVTVLYSNTHICSQNTSTCWFWSGPLLHILKLSSKSQDLDAIKFTDWTWVQCLQIASSLHTSHGSMHILWKIHLHGRILTTSLTLNVLVHSAQFSTLTLIPFSACSVVRSGSWPITFFFLCGSHFQTVS